MTADAIIKILTDLCLELKVSFTISSGKGDAGFWFTIKIKEFCGHGRTLEKAVWPLFEALQRASMTRQDHAAVDRAVEAYEEQRK